MTASSPRLHLSQRKKLRTQALSSCSIRHHNHIDLEASPAGLRNQPSHYETRLRTFQQGSEVMVVEDPDSLPNVLAQRNKDGSGILLRRLVRDEQV